MLTFFEGRFFLFYTGVNDTGCAMIHEKKPEVKNLVTLSLERERREDFCKTLPAPFSL